MSSRLWTNKIEEIEVLLTEKQPDLYFITEANLWANVEDHEKAIPGHNIILPNTMARLGHARIVLLVKNHINVQKLNQFMNDDISTIWVRVGDSKKNSVVVGGIYREHQILGEGDDNTNWIEKLRRQEERWSRIVNNWRRAGLQSNCITIGDLTLDWLQWDDPVHQHIRMINKVQDDIETTGHVQLTRGFTRSWPHQRESLLDHIWTNRSDRILRHFNELRGDADHNCIGVDYAKKEIKVGGFNIKRRLWKQFDTKRFVNKVKNVDWTDVLEDTNVDTANATVEERLRDILNSETPMSTIQMRTRYNK